MIDILHIDIETYSSVNIKDSGAYKYTDSIDFEILLVAYAFDEEDVHIVDLANGEVLPPRFLKAMADPKVHKHAHNATFERICFNVFGLKTQAKEWYCSQVKAAYCGFPLPLAEVSKAMGLEEKGKLATGKALIKYFCVPCKPSKVNGGRYRNFPHHDMEKWEDFKKYCIQDVVAEKAVEANLAEYEIPAFERQNYIIDQEINDRGIKIDASFAANAIHFDNIYSAELKEKMKELTGVENPNSPAQLKAWLGKAMGKEITTLAKDEIPVLIEQCVGLVGSRDERYEKAKEDWEGMGTSERVAFFRDNGYEGSLEDVWIKPDWSPEKHQESEINAQDLYDKLAPVKPSEAASDTIVEVLELRQKLAKSSIKKYTKMLECICYNQRAHGLFQFYGASRTGRFAGRLIQLQNLPQNHLDDLEGARKLVAAGNYEDAAMIYDDISSTLSQLIRTAFVAEEGNVFAVADFAAIEARVIAWLAQEKWRMDVFEGDGKIYEASAAMMFNVPIEGVTKGSDYRAKGKIAELALGYQGALGALKQMGGEDMGLSDSEMRTIVSKWRKASPAIVALWADAESKAMKALRTKEPQKLETCDVVFDYDGKALQMELPSGRKLFYQSAGFTINKFGKRSIRYKGVNDKKQWDWIDTYGGKILENCTQSIARDLLTDTMTRLAAGGYPIVMHVHDEEVCSVPISEAQDTLAHMCHLMSISPEWAEGLTLTADGYITPFYKKD